MYKLYPNVKLMKLKKDCYFFKSKFIVFFEQNSENVFNHLQSFNDCRLGNKDEANIEFLIDKNLNEEAYKIQILTNKIIISYRLEVGAYYATLTLKQIFNQTNDKIYCLDIFDEPDLKIRGFMMDISRNKVPTVMTVKKIIDLMSEIKMNHLQLYVEGFSYGYPTFSKYLEEDGYLSVEEIQELEQYANQRFVDLVPNQNGFGHMTKWLEQEEFKHLTEVPEGIFLWGRWRKASTLNPLDPGSLELVKQMYADMLPFFKSKYFNMNFDEPFELGKGKSKEVCEQSGIGNVYIDFVLKAYDIIKKYNKIPMIWGDVLINHPELLHRLPQDMYFIDWGYDANYPFSQHLQQLKKLGIKFLSAPATTSWCSFLGRTNDWWENITNACLYTKKYQGEGVILTDWGDFGHLQFLSISYAPLVYSGLMTWRIKEGTFQTLRDYIDKEIFGDEHKIMTDTILSLGNYYTYLNEYRGNGTTSFYNFMWATYAVNEDNPYQYYLERNKVTILSKEKYEFLHRYLNLKIEEIKYAKMDTCEGNLIKDEIFQSIFLLKMIHKVNIAYNEDLNINERISYLEEVIASKEQLINEQKRLWLARNKSGGLTSSLSYLEKFVQFAEITLNYLTERGELNEG